MSKYRVIRRCSTRRTPDSDEWVNLSPGQVVDAKALPIHAPVDEWLASGHLAPVKEKKA
jgi:hypothetical protein